MNSPVIDPRHQRRDMRALESAIRKQFPLPDDALEQVAKVAMDLLLTGNDRTQMAAARLVKAIVEYNAKVDKENGTAGLTNARRDRTSSIAERLRVLPVSERSATGDSDSGVSPG